MEKTYMTNVNLAKLIKFLTLKMSPEKSVVTAREILKRGISPELAIALSLKPKVIIKESDMLHKDKVMIKGVVVENGKLVAIRN